MARVRRYYNVDAIFSGPAPASGFHFIDNGGVYNNNYNLSSQNINLVKPINRVQSFSYNVNTNRSDVLELGRRGTIHRSFIDPATVDVSFDYISHGILNEYNLGFYVNYIIPSGTNSGSAFYADNYSVCSISGFVTRDLVRGENEIGYPQSYRDKRNLFVLVGEYGKDINSTSASFGHSKSRNSFTIGIGNSYITNYQARAAVGTFPTCSVSYIGENYKVYASGSGCLIPALDSKTRSGILNKHFTLPSTYQNNIVSALRPGDITVSIEAQNQTTGILAIQGTGYSGSLISDIYDLGFKYSDIKIQSYEISLPLNREPLNSIGYKLPIDRQISFPVFTDLNFNLIPGDLQTGSLENLMNRNIDYNIAIKLKNPINSSQDAGKVAVQYNFRKAKFESINYNSQIGDSETADLSFRTEIDPDDLTKGFFMSGLLNIGLGGIQTLSAFLLKEDGDLLLQENSDNFIVQSFAFF